MRLSLSDITFLIRLLLDILVVWGLIYSGLRIVRNNSRTIQLVKGVLIIVLIKALAVWLGLNALNYLIEMFLNWGVVVILVVFQPEIRGMLEKVGKTTAILTTDVSVYRNVKIKDRSLDFYRKNTELVRFYSYRNCDGFGSFN